MALTIKDLGTGQLPAAKATLYTCPALTEALVLLITLTNTDSVSRTCNLYANKSGTSRRIDVKDVPLGASASRRTLGPITLEAGDLIEGDASAATVVDYTINGVEDA